MNSSDRSNPFPEAVSFRCRLCLQSQHGVTRIADCHYWLGTIFWLILVFWALAQSANAATTTIDFDPPAFQIGNSVSIPGISFPQTLEVFQPTRVVTFSPPNAARISRPCKDIQCSNLANEFIMVFDRQVSAVSLRVGSDDSTTSFCFPEGDRCQLNARLIGYDASGVAIAASADKLIADYLGHFGVDGGPITTELSISDPTARIRRAVLFIGSHLLGNPQLNKGRIQIDHLSYTVSDSPPPLPPPPIHPTIVITSPTPDQFFNRSFDLQGISGQVTSSGLLDFCVQANHNPPSCGLGSLIRLDGTFVSMPLGSVLHEGVNTVRATVKDLAGQVATAEVSVEVAFLLGDMIITGMEITQGIQRETIPLNTGGPQSYNGVRLIDGGKTIVRVFVRNLFKVYPPVHSIAAHLYGVYEAIDAATNTKVTLESGPIPAHNTLENLSFLSGNVDVPSSERADPDGAITFTLPSFWTMKEELWQWGGQKKYATRFPVHTIRAELEPVTISEGKYGASECSSCRGNNTMVTTGISFQTQETLTISPVKIKWTDKNGMVHQPPDPAEVFARTRSISPVAESGAGSLNILPYIGEVDITAVKNLLESKRSSPTPPADEARKEQVLLQSLVWNQVKDFNWKNHVGYIMGIAQGIELGVEAPTPSFDAGRYWACLIFSGGAGTLCAAIATQLIPTAVANYESPGTTVCPLPSLPCLVSRPLTAVSHEFYHSTNIYHAGKSCPNVNWATYWPPDDRGQIHGIGLDRREGLGGTNNYRIKSPNEAGQPSEWVDLMSYCLDFGNYMLDPDNGDYNAWISVRNWEIFGLTGSLSLPPIFSVQPTESHESTLRTVAMVDETGIAHILRVESGDGVAVNMDVADSPYHLVVKDQTGEIVSRTRVNASRTHIDKTEGAIPVSFISAEVPSTGAASLEITVNDVVIASRVRSANLPRITLLTPKEGDRVPGTGQTIVAWEANDADGDPLKARVEYSTDDGQSFRVIASGVSDSQVSLPSRLFNFSDKARIRVTVNDEFNDGVALSGRFQALGSPPEVRIIDTPSDMRIPQDVNLHLVGEAYDDAGMLLISKSLQWYDGKKLIGNGQRLDVLGLSLGLHIVRFVASDARGNSAEKSVSVEVLPPQNIPGLAPTDNFNITNITPRAGLPGTKLTIVGSGFKSATAVTFHGTPATFTVINNFEIQTTVPLGATTGPVCVTGPIGATCSSITFPGTGHRQMRYEQLSDDSSKVAPIGNREKRE